MDMKVTISVDRETCIKAKKLAKETGRTFSGLIRVSLERYMLGCAEQEESTSG